MAHEIEITSIHSQVTARKREVQSWEAQVAAREKEAAEAQTRAASREEEINKLLADHQSGVAKELEAAQKAREEATERLAAVMESARSVFDQARALRPQMEMV